FGGVAGATRAIDEMSRVVAPGGIVAIATEYQLEGGPYHEAFTSDQVRELFTRSDLRLVEPIDENVYRRYDHRVVDLLHNRHETPHMVVRDGHAVFTTVMVFLEKAAAR